MNCPTCKAAEMTAIGCRVSDRPFYWCPNCGTLKTCSGDEPFIAPATARTEVLFFTEAGSHEVLPEVTQTAAAWPPELRRELERMSPAFVPFPPHPFEPWHQDLAICFRCGKGAQHMNHDGEGQLFGKPVVRAPLDAD